jgi:putative membrane protein
MIQESKILKWFKKQERKNTWLVVLFSKPKLYLYNLLKRTIYMGLIMLVLLEIIKYFEAKEQMIPSTLHSLVGIVIGLLLVFRTNTAYDRWWEARKIFSSIHATFLYFSIKSSASNNKNEIFAIIKKLNSNIFNFVSTDSHRESEMFKNHFLDKYSRLGELFAKESFAPPLYGNLERKLSEIMEHFSSLERIKNTPIPISYSFHIKLSILIYLLTLPMGIFFGLGLSSIPLVMILFFIIAGIEIISNEIENPFRGDPNDLPIDDFKKETEKHLMHHE